MKDRAYKREFTALLKTGGMTKYFEEMALKGWMIEKMKGFLWTYRKIEPQKLTFSTIIYAEASEYDAEPTEGQLTFQEFCEHTGWKLAASDGNVLVFYNEQENPMPIETDPVVQVENIHKSSVKLFKNGSLTLFFICGYGGVRTYKTYESIEALLSYPPKVCVMFSMLCMVLLWLLYMTKYFIWYKKAYRSAEHGIFIPEPELNVFERLLLYASGISMILGLITQFLFIQETKIVVTVLAVYTGTYLLITYIKKCLKKSSISPEDCKTVAVISAVALYILAFFVCIVLLI